MSMRKSKIDKQILNTYNNEERFELQSILSTKIGTNENVYDSDGDTYAQKQILEFKLRLKHFQTYTRISLQVLLVGYVGFTLVLLPILNKMGVLNVLDKRSSVLCIQGSMIVFIHTKLLLTDHGMPGISNSQRVTKRQSFMIHGMVGVLALAIFFKNYTSNNGYMGLLVYFLPLTLFEIMLAFFQLWCYQTEKDIQVLVELSYAGKSL